MLLKRLELVGFKSFVQKTVLEFPAGITSVVGPNGSGKSNIIDAIRWLLGEREAKSMRSLKAEDLIFSGTPQKARLSLAQATITFDNHSRFFPVDYQEVSVRRRIERNGTAQYFINDAEVRLKDIIDFFAQSRLGTKGFTIINQGESDLFVRAAPKERRAMLEEILGLRQFQLKKHDAQLKLKSTKFNMEKVEALIEEITPHLRLLRRQTAKWEKHADVQQELGGLEKQYFGSKLHEIESANQKLEPKIKDLEKEIHGKSKELEAFNKELAKIEESGKTESKRATARRNNLEDKKKLFDRRGELNKEIGRLEAQIEILINQSKLEFDAPELVKLLEETRETIEDILYEADIKIIKNLLKKLFEKVNHVLDSDSSDVAKAQRLELESGKEKIAEDLEAIDKQLSELESLELAHNEELTSFNEVFRKAFEAVQKKKDEIGFLEGDKNKVFFEKERLNIRRQELNHQAEQSGRKLEEFSVSVHNDIDIAAVERQLLKLRAELASIGEIDQGLIKEAKETESRYQFLSTQLADLQKAYQDLVNLLKDLDLKIHDDFTNALKAINNEFGNYFRTMFGGGHARLFLQKVEAPVASDEGEETVKNAAPAEAEDSDDGHNIDHGGIEITISMPRKKINSLEMLSGGEKALVSLAVLFALISVSPPPFLVLDEVDAALDEANSRRFSELIKTFSGKTQFLVVTHNRSTMEAASVLYGVTMGEDGTSKVLSLKLE